MRQITTAGMPHDESKATSFMRDDTPIAVRAFSQWTPKKPDNGVRLSRNPRKTFPKCDLPHTSRPIPERCCLRVGRSGSAHLANAGLNQWRRRGVIYHTTVLPAPVRPGRCLSFRVPRERETAMKLCALLSMAMPKPEAFARSKLRLGAISETASITAGSGLRRPACWSSRGLAATIAVALIS
jgi:hypothetical protein